MILQAAAQLLPALLPRQNGQGIFSIFNPETHIFAPKQKKTVRTKISPQNFIQQGIANILQLNPFTSDNIRRNFKCAEGFRGPENQDKELVIQVENPDVVQKIMPVGHEICQLFASALSAMNVQSVQKNQISLKAQTNAMQLFLMANTQITANSQRIIETAEKLPIVQNSVPVFNGVSTELLQSIMINMNPPQIGIKNKGINTIQLSQGSYIGSIVWLQSIPISISQQIKFENSSKNRIALYTS